MALHLTITLQIFLFSCLYIIQLKADDFLGQNPCISKTTCHECIQTPSCAWCYQSAKEYGVHPRCFQLAGHQQLYKRCAEHYYFPSNSYNVVEQKPLTKGKSNSRKTRDTSSTWTSTSSITYSNGTTSTNTRSGGNFDNSSLNGNFGIGFGDNFGGSGTFGNTNFGSGGYNTFSGSSSSSFGGGSSGSFDGSSGTTFTSSSGSTFGGSSGSTFDGSTFDSSHTGSGGSFKIINGGGTSGGTTTFVNKTTHTTSYTETDEIIQITPQRVHMRLRARESYSFNVSYAQAQDYPVDLYYLMDLSQSMKDDKDILSSLGKALEKSMRQITSEFQLGFGSFVDKVVMPYVSTVESNLLQPCENCSAPYGYFHSMQLSKSTDQFAEMVKAAKVSGNLDAPEGGFDAIMQAVVCKEQIGWRDNARRLLVFSTDDGFHYAGDGKLGGIIKPNDGRCHLKDGYYSYSTVQDYPSISQLNLKVKENAINVIFAVTKERFEVYNKLKVHIEGASSGILSADSSNVVQFIEDQYKEISSTVELKDNATDGVEIKYYSKCGNASKETENNTHICDGFKVGDVIEFRLEVFLKECPKDRSKWNQTIQVYPVGLTDSVFIDLEMLCSCPCEHPGDPGYKENAIECSGFGTYKCGICECDPFRQGRTCECSLDSYINQKTTQGCIPPNSNETTECSGKGICICNKCECNIPDNPNERINGTWCQCDNFSCHRHNGKICGGNGICDCGKCKCDRPWTGDACDCYNDTKSCYPPFKSPSLECDGHGKCECGKCQCTTTEEGLYTGRYCERCPNCTEKICEKLKPCVLCQMYHLGPYTDEECVANCTNFTPVEVAVVQADEEHDEYACTGYDNDDCRFVFVYKNYNETHYIVKAQKDRECPTRVFLLGIVLGVIAAVVLMGLAILLMWKLVTTVHDRREFARFEKERMMAKWDTGENPIYKQATSTFKNPTYSGKGSNINEIKF